MKFEFKPKPLNLRAAVVAIFIGVILGSILVLISGYNPIEIFGTLLKGAAGSMSAFASSLRWTTPLLFTGVAAAISLKGGMFNIGVEGSLYMGGLAATILGLKLINMPGYILIPLMILTSMVAGAIWSLIPALYRVKLGASEIVPALMLNYVAIYLTDYIVHYYFLTSMGHEMIVTDRIVEQGRLASILQPYQLNYGLIIGIVFVFIFWLIMKKSKIGYTISITGLNPEFATFGGINVNNIRIMVMLISGAIAGVGGAVEIMGVRWRFETNFSPEFGFDGILAALLGGISPIGTMIGAFFMGFLKAGSLAVERFTEVSRAFATVIKGTIICFVSAQLISKYIGFDKLIDKVIQIFKLKKQKVKNK